MALYWIVHLYNGERRVFIQEGDNGAFARVRAKLGGHAGVFVEAHELNIEMARRVAKRMQGCVLSQKDAAQLLGRLGDSG
jgi:hypothetical protein